LKHTNSVSLSKIFFVRSFLLLPQTCTFFCLELCISHYTISWKPQMKWASLIWLC